MTDLEDRLRDTFAAIDRQLVVPPMADRRRHRPRGPFVLAAAAVIAAIALIVTSPFETDRNVDVTAATSTPDEFNGDAGLACQQLQRDRSGDRPQFATSEAYRVVATQRQQVILTMLQSLNAIPAPADDLDLPARVAAKLDRALERAGYVIELADLGRIDVLQVAWGQIDVYIDSALQILIDHGAEGCAP